MATGTALTLRVSEKDLATIDAVVQECYLAQTAEEGHFLRALKMATGLRVLEAAITKEMMADVMRLQGTTLGFVTDKDQGGGYDEATVKRCLIEALMRGAHVVGNEFNIISGRPYLTLQFYKRALRDFPGLTDLRLMPGVPQVMGERGALVPFSATWRLNGKPDSMERTQRKIDENTLEDNRIPVRVNAGMGADAILGKAERKFRKAIYDRLTGSESMDGDVEDAQAVIGEQPRKLDQLTEKLAGKANGSTQAPREPGDDLAGQLKEEFGLCTTLQQVNQCESAWLEEPELSSPEDQQIAKDLAEARRSEIRASRAPGSREPAEASK